ncbi:MAG: hypothetical protein FRX48_07099 [Lasallia pustulata]|uniref:Retrotransposon gag domain-containing protein n=1 Tax=Lasallia pustulata TaxID=136370 RepID=A0A5M8PIS9_9LECA|nr:MAG: hypothetical protein FRX48_07099 [Lasallia pustulata]
MNTTGSTQGGSKAAMPRAEVITTKLLKLTIPTIFTDDRKKLDTFLLQLILQAEESTRRMFASFNRFRSEIRMVFGDIDQEHTVECDLIKLRQTKSTADYTAHFTRLNAATNWEDAALTVMYYTGIKDGVKDKIARGD